MSLRRRARSTAAPAAPVAMSARAVAVELDGAVVLRGVDVDVAAGGWLGLVGPNGAGKTTLLRVLAGLISYEGSVRLGDGVAPDDPRTLARSVAFVPQSPVIPPGLSVIDYVMLGRAPHQSFGFAATVADERVVTAVLQRLELDSLALRRVDSLSGGERQRTVVARALAQEAPVLLLDEPTSALDVGHQIEVLEMVDELRRERGLTVVTALHDLDLAAQFVERVSLLVAGDLVASGPVAEVMTGPALTRWFGAHVTVTGEGTGLRVRVSRRREGPPEAPAPIREVRDTLGS